MVQVIDLNSIASLVLAFNFGLPKFISSYI